MVRLGILLLIAASIASDVTAFSQKLCSVATTTSRKSDGPEQETLLFAKRMREFDMEHPSWSPRRQFLSQSLFGAAATLMLTWMDKPLPAVAAASKKSLDQCLYTILRVREATEQETRLIKSGKFRDVQRANIKLAIRSMIQNYRLSDTFIAATTYLSDSSADRRLQADQTGQDVVQSLYTIMEYFDSADVQNLRVGEYDNMAGKEKLVLAGLDAARNGIDTFVGYFDPNLVADANKKIQLENELNEKEWDPKLGVILNPSPKST